MKKAVDFVKELKGTTVNELRKEQAKVEKELAEAEQEAAAWDRLAGTPNVTETTKDRHIKPHREYWRTKVTQLKGKLTEVRTDIDGLSLIAG